MNNPILIIFSIYIILSKNLTTANICSQCQCLGPLVECLNTDLKQVPNLTATSFDHKWQLQIGYSHIQEIPPFPKLDNLQLIDISHSQVVKIEKNAFINVTDLQKLNLAHNRLNKEALFKDVFAGPYNNESNAPLNLITLDLSYNLLEQLYDDTFSHLPNLKTLLLNNNNLHDLSTRTASAFADLQSLETLDLSNNGLDRLPAHFLGDLVYLKNVSLAGNKFNTIPNEINYVRKLQYLNLNFNRFESISKGDLTERLEYLEELFISGMPELTSVNEGAFVNLVNLRHLQMTNNKKLKIIHANAFRKSENMIEKLELQNNSLMTLRSDLVRWLSIDEVNIQDNPFTCDCNMEWVKIALLDHLITNTPTLSRNLICASPTSVQGKNMKNVSESDYKWECIKYDSGNNHSRNALIMTVIIVGSLLLLVALSIFTFIIYKNAKGKGVLSDAVKYRRTFNDDEEAVTEAVHS